MDWTLLETEEDFKRWVMGVKKDRHDVRDEPDTYPCFMSTHFQRRNDDPDEYLCTFVSVDDIRDFQERLALLTPARM